MNTLTEIYQYNIKFYKYIFCMTEEYVKDLTMKRVYNRLK